MSTQDRKRKRISREAMEARRPLSPDVLVDGDSEHAHQDPGPVRAARTARGKRRDEARVPTMARFMLNSAKDDHLPSMVRLLVDLSADKEARELAKRWARWHAWAQRKRAANDIDAEYAGPWDPHGGEGSERERLESWVLERMASEAWSTLASNAEARCDFAGALADDLGLDHDGPDEDTPAWHLCESAGWPS